MKLIKNICLLTFFILSNYIYAQYEIKNLMRHDSYLYNGVIYKNKLLIGSSSGVLELHENQFFSYNKSDVKGPIKIINDKIVGGRYFNKSDEFKNLLPEKYISNYISSLQTETEILLFSKGILFIFEKLDVVFKKIGSIRSISQNYIGTYNGIYDKNGLVLNHPTYTDGFIREYDNNTFICWHGLTVIDKDNKVTNYNDPNGKGVLIGETVLGSARDIIKVNNDDYVLFTKNGLFLINLQKQTSTTINKNIIEPVLSFSETDYMGLANIYFSSENKLFKYDLRANNLKTLYTSKSQITKAIGLGEGFFYILGTNLLTVEFSENKIQETVIHENIDLAGDMILFQNNIIITKDSGLDIYNPIVGKYVESIIIDEFNKRAHFIQNDTLKLGSVNGLYVFDQVKIQNIYFKSLKRKKPLKTEELKFTNLESILTTILILSVLSILILSQKINNPKTIEISDKISENENTLHNIEAFIDENIATVNVSILCEKFNLNPKDLYEIMLKVKPGTLIRKKRITLVKIMRKERKSEEEISKKTGFSMSYLKKI